MLVWKINNCYIFWEYVCSLRDPAGNEFVSYYYLWPARFYGIFPHYVIFEKEVYLNTKIVCFPFFVQFLPETFLILRRIQRDITVNIHTSSCKVPVILFRFWLNLIFSIDFRKYQMSWESFQWESRCSMRTDKQSEGQADSQTDLTKLIIFASHNFVNAPRSRLFEWIY